MQLRWFFESDMFPGTWDCATCFEPFAVQFRIGNCLRLRVGTCIAPDFNMPTISLLTSPAIADASHQVTAPGGYEWWYFDAEDRAGDLRLVAIFFQGFVFHPGYLRAYGKYRWWPTRNAPPLPEQFPCVYFVLYRGSEIVSQFMSQYPADAFSAATDRVEVAIGPNRLSDGFTTHPFPPKPVSEILRRAGSVAEESGSSEYLRDRLGVTKPFQNTGENGSLTLHLEGVPWILTGRGPQMLESQKLSANLTFAPRDNQEPMERRFFARDWSTADHHWVIANPLCEVSGEIELADSATGKTTNFSLNGRGYHDHNFGTGPIGPGLKRWMWGRVLLEDQATMFHYAQPRDAKYKDDIHMLETDAFGLRELPVDRFNADWSRRTNTLLRYPAWVEAGPLRLVNPRLIDVSPFYLRLVYDASIRGADGEAFCEIAYPHRLRWPVLGRMIEMSIRRESV
jgi:carotenoid 1,2-hydratase